MMATWLHLAGKCTEHDQRWPSKASHIDRFDRLASRTTVLRGSFEERTARGRSRGYLFLKHFVVLLLNFFLSILKELPLTPANKPCKDSDWFMNPFLSTNCPRRPGAIVWITMFAKGSIGSQICKDYQSCLDCNVITGKGWEQTSSRHNHIGESCIDLALHKRL